MTNSLIFYMPEGEGTVRISDFSHKVLKETEKAWGVRVNVGNYAVETRMVWLPKSQGRIIKATYENDLECLHVEFPRWLLGKNRFISYY